MKVTVFYERINKRLNERSKHQKTINYTEKYWLAADDFTEIQRIIKKKCCFHDDALIMRKIRVGKDEYMGCW